MDAKKRKLKVFTGNLCGTRRGLVRSTSKAKACAVIHCSKYEFNNFWGEWDCGDYAERFEADKLYSQPLDLYGEESRTNWVDGCGR